MLLPVGFKLLELCGQNLVLWYIFMFSPIGQNVAIMQKQYYSHSTSSSFILCSYILRKKSQ